MEEKNILKKLDEINTRMKDNETPTKDFLGLVDKANQLIDQLKKELKREN